MLKTTMQSEAGVLFFQLEGKLAGLGEGTGVVLTHEKPTEKKS